MNDIELELLEKEITRFVHETKGVFGNNVDYVWLSVFNKKVPIELLQQRAREQGKPLALLC